MQKTGVVVTPTADLPTTTGEAVGDILIEGVKEKAIEEAKKKAEKKEKVEEQQRRAEERRKKREEDEKRRMREKSCRPETECHYHP